MATVTDQMKAAMKNIGDVSDLSKPVEDSKKQAAAADTLRSKKTLCELTGAIFTGSVAQIKWATSITSDFADKAEHEMDEAMCRVNDESMPHTWSYRVNDAIKMVMRMVISDAISHDGIKRTMPAADIINRRGQLSVQRAEEIAQSNQSRA